MRSTEDIAENTLAAPPEAAALKALAKRSVSTGFPKLGSDPKRLTPPALNSSRSRSSNDLMSNDPSSELPRGKPWPSNRSGELLPGHAIETSARARPRADQPRRSAGDHNGRCEEGSFARSRLMSSLIELKDWSAPCGLSA